jgi:hypothetical protein
MLHPSKKRSVTDFMQKLPVGHEMQEEDYTIKN